jgi:hypothetical protein
MFEFLWKEEFRFIVDKMYVQTIEMTCRLPDRDTFSGNHRVNPGGYVNCVVLNCCPECKGLTI